MKLVGLMPVRNEAWVLGLSLRVALQWCDEVVCLDHASTDSSAVLISQIHDESEKRVWWRHEPDSNWNEMAHRQRLLEMSRQRGATHIAIIDADEILTGDLLCPIGAVETVRGATNHGPLIRDYVKTTPPGSILQLPLYNLRGSLDRYHANGIWGDRWVSLVFADDPRLSWTGDTDHHREPFGMPARFHKPIEQGRGGILHMWGASERRLRAKHALYKVSNRLRFPKRTTREIELMYNLWRSPADSAAMYPQEKDWHKAWEFRNVPKEWWQAHEDLTAPDGNVDLRGEPWQESMVRELLKNHGQERFQGLDLFGL